MISTSAVLRRTVGNALKKECRLLSTVATSATFQAPTVSAPKAIPSFKIELPQKRTFFGSSSTAAPAISDSEVTGLFNLWNDALATLDPDTVAKRYAKTSVLLPTVSDIPRTDYDSIKSYFVDFLQKKPQGVILESNVIKGDDFCMDAGIYEFTMGATGDKVKARYTYVYQYEDGEWKIAHHHSSIMPESFL
mmetsp:Transcript_14454/g.22065  ORF Transcript_14454/g.22065 Transcript_14454/m.22065 type:complete len:192 (-) Transcript_14454:147-722(-)